MASAVRRLGSLSMARGCARIDAGPDTAKIGSADRVQVHHARLIAVIGVRKTYPHGLDQYWTLLPFHLLWDGAAPTDDGQQKLPIGDGTAQRIAMKYPSEGGYQPGDTWDLYIGPDKRIVQITYHRGAPNPPHLVSAKYTDYKKAGPLLFSIDHPGVVDGKDFKITLSGVSVKLRGSDKWLDAE